MSLYVPTLLFDSVVYVMFFAVRREGVMVIGNGMSL